ncbi:MAG: kynureninase [Bacteroidota bacterium]
MRNGNANRSQVCGRMTFEPHLSFAQQQDLVDPLHRFREQFYIPQKNNKDVIYLCGNSLGLQPKNTRSYIEEELKDWETLGVEGHFEGTRPWANFHSYSKEPLSKILGTLRTEVVTMGSLTENLHLLLNAFYKPTGERTKILIEKYAFPSDHYAVTSQLQLYGYDSNNHLIEVEPDNGYCITTGHFIDTIKQNQDKLALILLPGIQYYTGQLLDIQKVTEAAHNAGIIIGFDLAHAVVNVPLQLHKHQVDFATWCSYKYMNSGPGGISGIFVHENHLSKDLQLKGWWGHEPQTRFKMDNDWVPSEGVDAWQLSNPNILSAAANLAALEIIDKAGIANLRAKSVVLTTYLEYLINQSECRNEIKIITPSNPEERGAQLSIKIDEANPELIRKLSEAGVVLDYREPKVIRVAPVPLYNTFTDVWHFVDILNKILKS